VLRREEINVVRVVMKMNVEGKRDQKKKTKKEMVEYD
jgi:hypothetical protein